MDANKNRLMPFTPRTVALLIFAAVFLLGSGEAAGAAADPQDSMGTSWIHPHGVYLFEENFDQGSFLSWSKYTLDDQYALDAEPPRVAWGRQERIKIVAAPLSRSPGNRAVQFTVPRALNSFRSELALTAENGFHERWYGLRVFVPRDWILDSPNATDSEDIVTQWHHIIAIDHDTPGKYPPLAIAIKGAKWTINSNYGVEGHAQRDNFDVPGKVEPGQWVSWVLHIKWSPDRDGVLQIWKDGALVVQKNGPNTYQSNRPRTPYWKIGIYHPNWKTRNAARFNAVKSSIAKRVIVIDDVKLGDERASYRDVAPALEDQPESSVAR